MQSTKQIWHFYDYSGALIAWFEEIDGAWIGMGKFSGIKGYKVK